MREIHIKGLFGLFDHIVPLDQESGVTIVHAPNGYGKSRLMGLVDAALALDIGTLIDTSFSELGIDLSDGPTLTVSTGPEGRGLRMELSGTGIVYDVGRVLRDPSSIVHTVIGSMPWLVSSDDRRWPLFEDTREKDVIDLISVFERYPKDIPMQLSDLRVPKGLRDLLISQRFHRLGSQRILLRRGGDGKFMPAVRIYSDDLHAMIERTVEEYSEVSQRMDATYPERLVDCLISDEGCGNIDGIDLQERLLALRLQRRHLMELGILTHVGEEWSDPAYLLSKASERSSKDALCALSLYMDDEGAKLAVFEDITRKVDYLTNHLNSLYLFKRIGLGANGVEVTMINGRRLDLEDLSAGEQQLFIMTHYLLFEAKRGSVVVIDEPEISLHVSWQQHIVPNLIRLAEMEDIQIIITTHSPQIVHDRWDLTVGLGGVKYA